MKLKQVELLRLLPVFMQDDQVVRGIAVGTDEALKIFDGFKPHMSVWNAIDEMTEEELDNLAWELNTTWYEKGASIDVKRQILKDADNVSRKLGTKWAVERVISTYFGDGEVTEWFEYSGTPGMFKIKTSNPTVSNEDLTKFLRILDKVKRASAHLDEIIMNMTTQLDVNAGAVYSETSYETVKCER